MDYKYIIMIGVVIAIFISLYCLYKLNDTNEFIKPVYQKTIILEKKICDIENKQYEHKIIPPNISPVESIAYSISYESDKKTYKDLTDKNAKYIIDIIHKSPDNSTCKKITECNKSSDKSDKKNKSKNIYGSDDNNLITDTQSDYQKIADNLRSDLLESDVSYSSINNHNLIPNITSIKNISKTLGYNNISDDLSDFPNKSMKYLPKKNN